MCKPLVGEKLNNLYICYVNNIRMYVEYVYMYLHKCVYMYIYIYIYIYIYKLEVTVGMMIDVQAIGGIKTL
jgi:hypothetical protein